LQGKTNKSEESKKDLASQLESVSNLKADLERKLKEVSESDAQVKAAKQQLEQQVQALEAQNKQQSDETAGLNEKIVALNVQLQETVVARQKVEENFTQKSELFSSSVSL
jgi:chromosome segregation ATPase